MHVQEYVKNYKLYFEICFSLLDWLYVRQYIFLGYYMHIKGIKIVITISNTFNIFLIFIAM